MKKINILYWIFTGLFAAFMLFSAIDNIMMTEGSVTLFTHLGYPVYLITFMGVAKFLGVVAIVIPGFPRLKEWAYAGLFFDLAGATYSVIATDGLQPPMLFMVVPFAFEALSYIYYHKRKRHLQADQYTRTAPVTA
jgi:uncharacterized membrane protein YphA (DoxX/SURF4 family)